MTERIRHAWPCPKCKQAGTMDGKSDGPQCKHCKGHGWLHYCHGKGMTCSKIIPANVEQCNGCEYNRAHGKAP